MQRDLYLAALSVILCFAGCRHNDPEPDFSGIQNLPYTVQQTAGTTTSETNVRIFPNPFFDHVRIMVDNPAAKSVTIYVSDEKGKYNKKFEVHDGGTSLMELNFSKMPKGVYICEIQQEEKASRYRLVKAQ